MADLFSPIDQGFECFIIIKHNTKKPVSKDWMNNGKTFEEACVSGSNVGILLGKHSGLLDIDLDCKEAVALADIIFRNHLLFLIEVLMIVRTTSIAVPHSVTVKLSMVMALKQLLLSFVGMVLKL